MHMVATRHGCESAMVGTRVTCTWWMLGMAVKAPWLGPGGPILALAAWMQGDMHMVAARHSCQSTMVGTRWANSYPGFMDTG